MTRKEVVAARQQPCPYCGAKPGQPCVSQLTGWAVKGCHVSRVPEPRRKEGTA